MPVLARSVGCAAVTLVLAACGGPLGGGGGSSDGGSGPASESAGTSGGSSGSASDTETPTDCAASVETIAAEVFAPRCAVAECHSGPSPSASLDLSESDPSALLVGVESRTCDGILVVPGAPASSVLLQKLIGTHACGDPMPPPGGGLDDAQIDCIRAWIEGAEQTCETCGGDACIDLATAPAHCGDCDASCPAPAVCAEGVCTCDDGQAFCAGSCVDTESDPAHCGECDLACEAPQVCNAGNCADDCGALTNCSGACVDVMENEQHCGGCDSPCPVGQECDAGQCACAGGAVSYAGDVEPIFVSNCANMGCHGFPMPSDGLDLSSGAGYDELVDRPSTQCAGRLLVEPGNPGDSYLYDKLLGVDLCSGTAMPKNAPLAGSEIDTVEAWICGGALP